MDDGQVVLPPARAATYLNAFDAALADVGGTCFCFDGKFKSAARLAGAPAAEPPRKKLAGTCVRLFKYLAADYYEEFVHSCDLWLRRNLRRLGC